MIFVARHGETVQNRARVLQVPEDPLSDAGRAQAAALAERLAELGVGSILTSDYARARMTAEAVGRATGARLEVSALLRERNFGDLRGTPYAELRENIFAPEYRPPGGEDGVQFEARVARAWEEVREHVAGSRANVCVVTHGLVCRALVANHFEWDEPVPSAWSNTALTVVEAVAPWRVERVACATHLDAIETPESAPV